MLGLGLLVCGVVLIGRGVRTWRDAPAVSFAPWTRSGRIAGRVALVPAGLLVYVLSADDVGFLPTATLVLAALMVSLGRRVWPSLGLAVVATLLIQIMFGELLRVPLPWGVLRGLGL